MASSAERILIVDSNPDIIDLIARQALRPLGYHVTVTSEMAGAIKQSLETSPDLILTNLNLPGLSGKDLLVALNSQGIKAPSIVIAENGQEQDAIQALRLGASDVLFWPARDAEVVAAVERALSQTKEARARQKLDQRLKITNEELQRKVRELTLIHSIGKAVVSLTDQRQLFERILEGVQQISEADMAWLLLREEHRNIFLLSAHRNLPEAWARKLDQPLEDGLSSLVAHSGESLLMHGQPLERFKISTLGKSAGVVPIKVHNDVIGLLLVVRKAGREFGPDTQALLEAMADYASVSLVNARLFRALEQTAQAARSGEKMRYAALESVRTAIHDEVQAAGYSLNLVLTEMPGALSPEQQQALEAVRKALQRLAHLSERTVPPDAVLQKEKNKA